MMNDRDNKTVGDIPNIRLFKKILGGNVMTYVSTPLNTGNRYIKWTVEALESPFENREDREESFMENVMSPNVRDVREFIDTLRQNINDTVIDPSRLEYEDVEFTQEQFYEFWDNFIREFVDEIVFMNGWEYSVGCSYEYLSAVKYGIKIYGQDLLPIELSNGITMISNSAKEYVKIGESDKVLKLLDIVKELRLISEQ